jgi:hypothetical protein
VRRIEVLDALQEHRRREQEVPGGKRFEDHLGAWADLDVLGEERSAVRASRGIELHCRSRSHDRSGER